MMSVLGRQEEHVPHSPASRGSHGYLGFAVERFRQCRRRPWNATMGFTRQIRDVEGSLPPYSGVSAFI